MREMGLRFMWLSDRDCDGFPRCETCR